MTSVVPQPNYPRDGMLDIDAELSFWRLNIHSLNLSSPGSFDQYVPVVKFGYDTYLRMHPHTLETCLPALQEKYHRTFANELRRLNWLEAELIIRKTWERMREERAAMTPE